MYPLFELDIAAMNSRYKLANLNVASWNQVSKRLAQFKDILDKEFTELEDIQRMADGADDSNWGVAGEDGTGNGRLPLEVVTAMADLLGDIIIYCASEAQRWGIPLPITTNFIMFSNTSKLGEDGEPIINPENGKFEKGPNYWKPEPLIEYVLTHKPEDLKNILFTRSDAGVVSYEITKPLSDKLAIIELPATTGEDNAPQVE